MASQKVYFSNTEGVALAAYLDLPANQLVRAYAIFAHCFTCSSQLGVVRHISRSLNLAGFGVLRFDFTGLGQSEGSFSETNFSTNISDLLAAATWLDATHEAATLLVGHSLGGAAVLYAAQQLPSVKAVATIGAPASASHITHLLEGGLETIEKNGAAQINIGGRPFTVKQQFLADLAAYQGQHDLAKLQKALLILHSPQDRIVAIEEAAKIYQAARHPKSFVSLDGADHLLSNTADSRYTGQLIASWARRYIPEIKEAVQKSDKDKSQESIFARLGAEGLTTEIMVRQHQLLADEPVSLGGKDQGPSPHELLSAGLAACTVMTLQLYARRKQWPLEEVSVEVVHSRVAAEDPNNKTKIDQFERHIQLQGELTSEQQHRLLEIANRCPVHKSLEQSAQIKTLLR